MDCASCGRANRPAARFCAGCGNALAPRCPACGAEAPLDARFCEACGATLDARPVDAGAGQPPARKVVTIVFADLIGSTALQERLDAEAVSRMMDRYHRAVRAPIEAHGGTVVQLLGDGVMCAFGIPNVAEDDAIRAVRAGVAVQEAFREFRAENQLADRVGLRVAVNTGEVVVSDDYAAGIGDPLNVAAHLQHAAQDGDVLIGESTRRLVSELVTLAPIGALELKGRREAVAAYRVVSLDRPAGASATPFVGRESELRRLRAVYDDAISEHRARLAVILGSPGLGKSRVLAEVARRLQDEATVLTARCDQAGGGTFAPLAAALRELLQLDDAIAGDALRSAIAAAMPGEDSEHRRIASGVAALIAGTPAPPEETFFVVRRFLGALAETRPIVLAIDDLQWAEPLLFDLTEHLVQWTADAPLLVLVAARPELRETRSSLATPGGLVSEVVTLSGLDALAAMKLAANAIGADELPAAVAGRVLAASEGNPLFVGELVRMLVHDGALVREKDHWTVGVELAALDMPPTIQALLAARIEKLRPEERTVLERASVVGRQFSRAAVKELLPREIADLDRQLEALRRTELIESDTGWFLGEPALRFHHVLIRDAAYRRLLKNTRAELHARFAEWVVGRVGDEPPHDETIGWHLEQAHQHLSELGPIDAQGRALGERASKYLASAGRRALARDDVPVAASLLGRALERLEPDDSARAELALDWCEALLAAGEVATAERAIEELGRFTAESDRLRAWHTCFAGERAALTDPKTLRTSADAVSAAAEQLTAAGDSAGEAKAHFVHAIALARLGKVGACEAALDRALAAARRAGDRRRANAVLSGAPLAALWGPSPVTRASGRCLDVVRVLRITQGSPAVEAVALRCQGVLEALRGRSEAARRMIASSRRMVEELGITHRLLQADQFAGEIELIEGDPVAAERCLRAAYDGMRELGLGSDAAQCAAQLGRALLAQDRAAEAEAISHESEALAGDDLHSAIAWRDVRAEALARRGEPERAVELARAAVETAAATDALLWHAEARTALAAALRAAGRRSEAAAEEARATSLWETKGATLLVERAREGARDGGIAPVSRPTHDVAVDAGVHGHVGREEPKADPALRGPTPAPPARRRVRENAATAAAARIEAAVRARDEDAMLAAIEGFEVVHHPTGLSWDSGMATLESTRRLWRSDDFSYRLEPLATLGESLALCRQSIAASGNRWQHASVGPYEMPAIVVVEAGAEGQRASRFESFAADRLGDAVARLYERYAESLPEGLERARAAVIARFPHFGPYDPERYAAGLAPDIVFTDHRILGTSSARGSVAVEANFRSWTGLGDELQIRTDEILDLGPDAYVFRGAFSGIARDGGGAFERDVVSLAVFGADGRVSRFEVFDSDREADALARFDVLTAGPPARPSRRVRPNAATAVAARVDAAYAAHDVDAYAALQADDVEIIDHATGVTHGRAESLATMRILLRAEGLVRQEPLATLGDSLALCRCSVSGPSVAGGGFDVGAYDGARILLLEADAAGRYRRIEMFSPDRFGDAIVRLYERHAEQQRTAAAIDRAAAIARAITALAGPVDLDRFRAPILAPDIEWVDHRSLIGMGSIKGSAAALEWIRTLTDAADQAAIRLEDVIDLRADALLFRATSSGTDRASGGSFERPFVSIWIFDANGLVSRAEQFDPDRESDALARFDALTSEPARPARRVRPNTATVQQARLESAVAARDIAACAELFPDDTEVVDHLAGTTFVKRDTISAIRALLASRDLSYRVEPLASLGDSLALTRLSVSASGVAGGEVDVASYSSEEITLNMVSSDGHQLRAERFRADRLGNAIVRLYERYAELLPEGAERTRAAAFARAVANNVGRVDTERYAASLAPDIESFDHRTVGAGQGRGPELFLNAVRSLLELAPDAANRFDDILALRPDACLVRQTNFGTLRASGGAYERPYLSLSVAGPDGRLARFEMFEPDQIDAALAAFDASTSPSARPARRVRPNGATTHLARVERAVAARDEEEIAALYSDDTEVLDHEVGITYGRREILASLHAVLAGRDLSYRVEPLATLGDSLALARIATSASGVKSSQIDVGDFANEMFTLSESNAEGLQRYAERFAPDRLGAAVTRLYERYAEILPEGPERARAASTARSVGAVVVGGYDLERYTAAYSPAIEMVDRRKLGSFFARGPEAVLEMFRSWFAVADDIENHIDEILGLGPSALLVRTMFAGTARDGGGRFESPSISLMVFGSDGLQTRLELFELTQEQEALARFDELTAAPRRRARRVRPNAATANGARYDAAMAARDLSAAEQVFTDDTLHIHHPTGITYDRQGALTSFQIHMKARDPKTAHEPVATLGGSLALLHVSASASALESGGFDVGAYENHHLVLIEADREGRRSRAESFSEDRLGDAIARLYARYAELEPPGPGRARCLAIARAITVITGPMDLARSAALFAPDVEWVDHRSLVGIGSIRGAAAFLDWARKLAEIADGVVFRMDDVIDVRSNALLCRSTSRGTLRASGSTFERRFIFIWIFDAAGLVSRVEQFDAEHADDALARFDALVAEPTPPRRSVRPNTASAYAARLDTAIAARDLQGLDETLADPCEFVDRSTGTEFGRQGMLDSWRSLLRARDPVHRTEPIATLGDSLALCRTSAAASGFTGETVDVGPYELENITIFDVDAAGRLTHCEIFASDRLGDALVRLYERHVELLPEGPERTRAAATARTLAVWHGPADAERFATIFARDVIFRDRRSVVSLGTTRGADAVHRGIGIWFDTVADLTFDVVDVVAVRPERLLIEWHESGTDRASGGAYEAQYLSLRVFGAHGLATFVEWLDVDRRDEALARFEELTEAPTPSRPLPANAATAHTARVDEAIALRNTDALVELVAERAVILDHKTGTTFDREGWIASFRSLMKAREPQSLHEPLAILGDSLGLFRRTISATGFAGATLDVGSYLIDELDVLEADEQGRIAYAEVFAVDRLSDAIAKLYERYASEQPEGAERRRATAIARAIPVMLAPLDPDAIANLLALDVQYRDHRLLGWGSARGLVTVRRGVRDVAESITFTATPTDEILALRPDALLVHRTLEGEQRGVPFRSHPVALYVFDANGRLAQWENYDADERDAALARLDELVAPVAPPRLVENAATRSLDQFVQAWAARDWEAVRAVYAPEMRMSDRRSIVQLEFDLEEQLEFQRPLFEMKSSRVVAEIIATRGDRLALARMCTEVADGSIGPSEISSLAVWQVNPAGKAVAGARFDLDARDEAYAELDARYGAGEATEHPATWTALASLRGVLEAGEWGRIMALFSPDLFAEDHRLFGWGSANSPAEYVAAVRSLSDVAPDVTLRVDHVVLGDRAALFVASWIGSQAAGAFEIPVVTVFGFSRNGQVNRAHHYSLEQIAAARARFAEVEAPAVPARAVESAATRSIERFALAWSARDWKAVTALYAPGFRYIDQRSLMQLDIGLEHWFEFARPLFDMATSRISSEILATRGERLALSRMLVEVAGGSIGSASIGPSEIDSLIVCEVDAHGQRVANVRFDPNALDAAYAELDRRYAVGEAAEHPEMWAAISSMQSAISERNWGALPSRFSPDYIREDHRDEGSGTTHGSKLIVDSVRTLIKLRPDVSTRADHVELADRAALVVTHWVADELEDPFEVHSTNVFALGPDGTIGHDDIYDPEQLSAARARFAELATPRSPTAELDARYATGEAAAFPHIAGTMHAFLDAFALRDWDALAARMAPDLVVEDHRLLGWETVRSTADYVRTLHSLVDLAPDTQLRLDHAEMSQRGLIWIGAWVGTRDGGAFETPWITVSEHDARGIVLRFDQYDLEQLPAARARFEELRAKRE